MNLVKPAPYVAAVASVVIGATGCGSQEARLGASPATQATRSASIMVMGPGEQQNIPNPGTGTGDPRLAAALLTRFPPAQEEPDLPGAVVAMPVTDTRSMFIGFRQVSSPLDGGPECMKWTSGMAFAVVQRYNTRGVQLAVTKLNALVNPRDFTNGTPDPHRDSLVFSMAIVTGPAPMVQDLGNPAVPAACGHLTDLSGETGAIEPLPVPPLGLQSWAYRVTGTGKVPVWQWVEVVRTTGYVLEVRIPNQGPEPRTAPEKLLPKIAEAAFARAQVELG